MDRIKLTFKIAGYILFLLLVAWYFSGSLLKSYDLSQHGKVTTAKVTAYQYSESNGRKGRTKRHHDHLITFGTHRDLIDLGKEVKIGTEFYIVYSTANPSNFVAGKTKHSVFEYLKQEHGLVGLIIGLLLVIFLPLEILTLVKRAISPPSRPQPTLAEVKQAQIEIGNARVRITKPLKKSVIIALVSFVLLLVLGDHKGSYSDLILTSASFSAAIFFIAYLFTYKPKKN